MWTGFTTEASEAMLRTWLEGQFVANNCEVGDFLWQYNVVYYRSSHTLRHHAHQQRNPHSIHQTGGASIRRVGNYNAYSSFHALPYYVRS